jgi:uncharacterized membrane protein YeaQ/YmgE (transglycosylase-associated protein family)
VLVFSLPSSFPGDHIQTPLLELPGVVICFQGEQALERERFLTINVEDFQAEELMYWVYVFFVGLAVGWIAGQMTRGRGFGLIGNLVVGIVGSFIGGIVFRLVGLGTYGVFSSFLSALIGAVIFLWLLNQIKR